MGDWALMERTMNEWRPIKTAPTDGTKFLAVTGNGKMRVDWFDATLSTSQNAKERGDDRYTHWMPLPAYPRRTLTGTTMSETDA